MFLHEPLRLAIYKMLLCLRDDISLIRIAVLVGLHERPHINAILLHDLSLKENVKIKKKCQIKHNAG